MPPRVAHRRYDDPLDLIWTATAARLGLRLERTTDVYASTDGQGLLQIGAAGTLDPDDSLAALVLHELCHALVAGEAGRARADWGLDNTSDRDAASEHACLRLQAHLAGRHGLRALLAPTTEHRAYYDALAADPLAPSGDPAAARARAAAAAAAAGPWGPALEEALAATAAIARIAAPYAATTGGAPAAPLRSLFAAERVGERHPLGGALGPAGERCAGCAWRYEGGPGPRRARCRQHRGARIDPAWPACAGWDGALDCRACAACCREAYDSVTIGRREPVVRRHPALVLDRGGYLELARADGRCAALHGGPGAPYACAIYDDRPRPCRDFAPGGGHCLEARRRVGLTGAAGG